MVKNKRYHGKKIKGKENITGWKMIKTNIENNIGTLLHVCL